MKPGRTDPARLFVRGFGSSEGIEWGFWLVLMVFWVVELELGAIELMVLGIVLEGTVLLAETPTGVVADLKSRKRSVIIAQVLMGVSYIWSMASLNFWMILPAQALVGIGWTFRSGADTAWVTDELKGAGTFDDDDIDRLILHRHRFSILVALLSVPITIGLALVSSVRIAGVIMGVIYLAMAWWFQREMVEDHFTPGEESGSNFRETLRTGIDVVRSKPRLRVLVGVIALSFFGGEAFDRLGAKYFLDNAAEDGFTAGQESIVVLGVMFFVMALAGLAVNAAIGHYLDNGVGVVRLAVALLLAAFVGGVLGAATSMVLVVAIGFTLQDGVREALWPVLEGWANRDAPSEVRATVNSLMGQTTSLGELGGALVLGAVAELVSIQMALVVGAFFYAIAGVVSTRAIDR